MTFLKPSLAAATVVLLAGARYIPGRELPLTAYAAPVAADASGARVTPRSMASGVVAQRTKAAVEAFSPRVRAVSHPRALETAFRSYYAFQAENADRVKKPLLYFVDYGLPSTKPRGWVFDMQKLVVVEGPFTVAHGRGSSPSRASVPTHFSNRPGSAATSLGLYLAQETYAFRGKAGGKRYRSIGLRLEGVSGEYNDNARVRGVVAHGAPYVTAARAGRSEGCPAMEEARAQRLLPRLAHGGMVFHFAPEREWMTDDPWVVASGD